MFVGTGERPTEFDAFHPDRMVGRILGMGDLLGLIEKAEEAFDADAAKELEKKIRKNSFTLEDFRDQLKTVRKIGPLSSIVSMLPGMSQVRQADLDENAVVRVMAILDSMTARERQRPEILNGSRKRRISRGAGQSVAEINRLLKQFAHRRKMLKTRPAARPGMGGKGGLRLPFLGR
jgi:signal recognition particle subunit SRP54